MIEVGLRILMTLRAYFVSCLSIFWFPRGGEDLSFVFFELVCMCEGGICA